MAPDPTIRQTGEDALVARLRSLMPSNAALVTGPGDDCAVARSSGNRQMLLKTDCVVEGLHFLPGTDPELIGRKALARAVSDIGAMGGTPLHALVTLLVHADRPVSQVEGIYRGMGRLAQQFGISIAGGESSGLPED
uniref:AIR synthase related protein n=1 Tax=uncultured Akkermansia sp. TaxID=512294 RepID=UPI00265D5FCA